MARETLHADARHRITLFRAAAPTGRAVVCFEAGRDRMRGFGDTACPGFAARLGLDALMVQTAQRDWFVSHHSPALAQALRAATAAYDEVTATGFSMGGYGALLYSAACHARRVMVVSPQYCIDPARVAFDPARAEKFARIGMAMPRPDEWGDTAVGGFMLYDPAISADRGHAALIAQAFPAIRAIALPYAGHPASGVLGEIGRMGALATMLVEDRLNVARIRRWHREARRQSAHYRLNIARAALRLRPARAAAELAQIARDAAPAVRLEAGLALLTHDCDAGSEALDRLLNDTASAPPQWARRIKRALDALDHAGGKPT